MDMNKIKTTLNNKKTLFIAVGVVSVVLLLLLFISRKRIPSNNTVIHGGQSPPVVQTAPELKFIKATPLEGSRETFDTFSQTFFEFSADIDQNSANITVLPHVAVKVTAYESEKRVLVVEPVKTPWSDGVEYTITINRGLRGVAGEELKQDVQYKFSNTQPAVFEGGDPIPLPR